jgi:hypothetical protein
VRVTDLSKFIVARHQVYENRMASVTPWTKDPILATYRFCNVYRELDRVTIWIDKNWRYPMAAYEDMWFYMVVARLVNHPPTMADMKLIPGLTLFNPRYFVKVLEDRAARGERVYNPAYIVSTNGRAMPKARYLAEQVLTPLWQARDSIRPRVGDTLQAFHARLMQFQGMGSFMAAQVVADVKNAPKGSNPLTVASDWRTWAAPGPGSLRGMSRVVHGDIRKMPEANWQHAMSDLRPLVNERIWDSPLMMRPLHAQDLQNCLCEFDKYERVRTGQGKPKQKYVPEKQQK